ncbi:MAG: efflux RND transporter permease subunit, partial [Rhizobiales bacterium]|nr:efflux RND transporter permease subunit [Hyphomicrobiales bacterium]
NRNIDAAALDVQTALTVAQRRMPPEMTIPPSFRKVNPGDFPILFIAMSSDTLPLSRVNEYADITLAQAISQIPGVAQVLIYGTQKFAVRVRVDPEAAAARGLAHDDIRAAVARANSSTPVGIIAGDRQNITLTATGQMQSAAEYNDVIVAWRNGVPVKLNEVATVIDSVDNDKVASWFNDKRAITLAIQRQPDANTVEVVDLVRARLPALRAQVPPSVEMNVMMDRSMSIRESVHDVQGHMSVAIALVLLVIFLFLRSGTATLIPSLAVPISLIGTCAAMYAFGFSINNMTLLALTLSIGFVVDDAIVMLENIVRHIENGMRPFEAALKGSKEIGFTIISITVSLIAVFIPVLLMGGMVGRIFREFAVTIAIAIIISGFVSLTLTPMLCARMLRGHDGHAAEKRPNIVFRAFEGAFNWVLRGYERALDVVLRYKFVTLMVTFATLAGTIYLYIAIPKGFFPNEDTGFLIGITEGATDSSFDAMVARQAAVAAIIRKDPAVDYVSSTVGAGGPNPTTNFGRFFIALKPKQERGPLNEVMGRLRRETATVTGLKTGFQSLQNIRVGGRISKGEFQYTLQSGDTASLYAVSPELRDKIAKLDMVRDVDTDLYIKNPQMTLDVDRAKAAVYGITIDQVRQALFNAFGSRQVGTIFTATNDYQIIMENQPRFMRDP